MEKRSRTYSREIGINSGLLFNWVKKDREKEMEGLVKKRNKVIHYPNILRKKLN